ncbi:SWPV1-013 [Shearwaterpox virus]|uniref:SWPV1-013 n=1 Tax=Shearwaterpox virus TaxID=1974596 RepID=A0A1V0S7N1_CNPV|nr:SWPV1-013 [Shearwaterpox virus]
MSAMLKILNEIYRPGESLCISPRGLYTVLMNIMIGCKKDTMNKIKDILGIFGSYAPIPEKEEFYTDTCDDNNKLINESVMLIEKEYPVKKDFINSSIDIFNTKVVSFDRDEEVAEKIRKWIISSTNGFIKEFDISLGEDTRLAIINLVYLNLRWKYPFCTERTTKLPFEKYDGSKVRIDTMIMNNTYNYYKYDECLKSKIVVLEYDDYRFEMFIIIPDTATGIDGVVSSFKNSNVVNRVLCKKDMSLTEIDLYLPKFNIEYEVNLIDALINIGCGDIFKTGELVNVSDVKTLRISTVRQKSILKIDEKGTEAASVTELCSTDGISNIVKVHANVPFMCLVADIQTKIPLFVSIFQG